MASCVKASPKMVQNASVKTNNLKYFLYARKGSESEDKQIASIDFQIEELKRVAEREGLELVDVLSESRSAKEPGRPVFTKILDRIREMANRSPNL